MNQDIAHTIQKKSVN